MCAARHVVEEEKDIQRAMSVLQQCELLKIEDVLPFFPDFTTIDLFKVSQPLPTSCFRFFLPSFTHFYLVFPSFT